MVNASQKRQLLYVLFFVFLSAVFLLPLLYKDNISISNTDVLSSGSYFETLVKGNLKEGLSFWNPYVYSGTLYLGNPLSSLFYPPNLLHYIMPYVISYKILVFLYLSISLVFMFFYLRLIKRSVFSSIFGAISFAFSGMYITWLFIPSFIGVIFWFPLVIFLIELLVSRQKYYLGAVLSVVYAVQILSGGVQIFFYSLFISVAYFVLRLIFINVRKKKEFAVRQSKYFLFFIFVGFIISLSSLLPIFEFGSQSIRSGGVSFEDASLHSVPPYGFLTLLMPNFFGNPTRETYWAFWKGSSFSELTFYAGIGALIFSLIALFFFRDRYVKIFFIIALFCVLFALGKYFFVFKFFYSTVPGFELFRVPARMMMFFVFSVCVMSSFGLDYLLSRKVDKNAVRKFVITNYVLVSLGVLGAALFILLRGKIILFGRNLLEQVYYANLGTSRVGAQDISFFASKIPLVYKEILFSILLLLFFYFAYVLLINLKINNAIKLKKFKAFVIILLIFDLWIFSASIIRVEPYSKIYEKNNVVEFFKENAGIERVLYLKDAVVKSSSLPTGYVNTKEGIYRVDGCEGIALLSYYNFVCKINNCIKQRQECVIIDRIENKNFINLLNVRYILSDKKLEGYSEVFSDGRVYVYKNSDALPRAFIVHNYVVVEDRQKILDIMSKKEFDPSYFLLFYEQVNYNTAVEGFDKEEYAKITKYSPDRIEIEAKLNHPGFLVLSEINYVGWDAFVDGVYTPILNADYMFRSVYLESDEHKVTFEYNPASFKLGFYLSAFGVLLALVTFVYFYLEYKKSKK